MKLLTSLFHNSLFKWFALLCTFYIFIGAFGSPFNKFDYIFVLYIFALKDIKADTALKYAVLFGLFYDFNYQIFLGLGVLIFQVLNFVKVHVYQTIDMSKMYAQVIFILSFMTPYTILTLKFFGYSGSSFWYNTSYFLLMDSIAIATFVIFQGGKRVVSHS